MGNAILDKIAIAGMNYSKGRKEEGEIYEYDIHIAFFSGAIWFNKMYAGYSEFEPGDMIVWDHAPVAFKLLAIVGNWYMLENPSGSNEEPLIIDYRKKKNIRVESYND